ncbi:glycosyltransferase family 2 protein [Naumannella halotolerans]|uniref:Glycosyl transferase family 2 n=1 Tax=Naumannella halotolerans TaxID=993414 RepID=A0A4R7J103_9ACTN|nr:glycosyltransferase [Naumannella halotolerans]TDT29963.1 glycosyl transferase family 2 [Naumannella halotolerans]
MQNPAEISSPPQWHSNDFLIRVRSGEFAGTTHGSDSPQLHAETATSPGVGDASLGLVAGDPTRHEHLSVLRSPVLPTPRVRAFAGRHGSTWALDLLAERYSRGSHDWGSLRTIALRFAAAPREFEPTLDRLKLKDLWTIAEVLHERGVDHDGERALLTFISTRVLEGADFDTPLMELLLERLIYAGISGPARAFVSQLDSNSWRKHALAVDLEHPRFGGTYDGMLLALNSKFHQLGLERIRLDGDGQSAFQRLDADPHGSAQPGPLVTVILTTRSPGPEALTAARSILAQTYRELELIVIDDGSPDECAPLLDHIAAMDPRVRVIRSTDNAGPYVRRNEALELAEGEFVTFQDASGWSHPRRIEIQVRDLVNAPGKLANLVRAARAREDLSLVGPRGARLVLSESSLLFRRDPVLTAIGFFDTVRRGAGTEFRSRLKAATGADVGFVGPDLPLEFLSTSTDRDAQNDFENGSFVDPQWLAYREAASRFHGEIRSGSRSAVVPFPQAQRAFSAPSSWLASEPSQHEVDLLLVLDAQWSEHRRDFLNAVADECVVALAAGMRLAILQSDSTTGPEPGPIASVLQQLIDSGQVTRVFDIDQVQTAAVVVRHAGAAQGHAPDRRPVTAERVVVVEDPAAGDTRGETIACVDVDATVTGWFGVEPSWLAASPVRPRPRLRSVIVKEGKVHVTLQATDARQLRAVRIGVGAESHDFPVTINKRGFAVAVGELELLPIGHLPVSVVRGEGASVSLQGLLIAPENIVATGAGRLLIADGRVLRVLPEEASAGETGAREFRDRYLSARITYARVFRDQLELTVKCPPGVEVSAIHAVREDRGRIRRRAFDIETTKDGRHRGIRELGDVLDQRWRTFAIFQTPLGPVQAPIRFDRSTLLQDSAEYQIRQLHRGGLDVIHVVEKPAPPAPDRVPMLSIVMPVFNVGPYLDTAIQSVLMQDFQDFELIIVDDASTDNGRQVIDMHRSLDPRIRVIALDHNTLGGAGVPSNLGIRAARGRYLAFVDSDDWVTKTAFAKLVQLAEDNDTELVIGNFCTFDENDRTVSEAYDSDRWRDVPLNQVISASSHPDLLRISPVPWRKLYRRDFVQAHHVLYPEGDYFYEDNPLHWHVLSRAERVIACDEIVSYHRMAREGQTMGAYEYKLGAIASHANTTLNSLTGSVAAHRELLFEQFIDYVSRQRWIVRRQTQPAAAHMIQRRLADIYERARSAEPDADIPQATIAHFTRYQKAYPELDLTIVIPVYNSADLLRDTLDSVLQLEGLAYDVLLIDDGSTDESLEILREYEQNHENVHVFEQKNRGAGRARNAVIPLCTGRYTYFLDADDTIDARALREAVTKATSEDADLLFVQYRIEYTDENRSRGMFNADAEIWQQLPDATENIEKQVLLAGLINYPWNRIIRTSLLHDANIFFGPTIVHNDVLYHWHSILSATHISYLDVEVCTHRKFTRRAQVTNIDDGRRMAVLEALRGTHERISELDAYLVAQGQWKAFALHVLDWARSRIPASLQSAYRERSAALAETLDGRATQVDHEVWHCSRRRPLAERSMASDAQG